MLVLADVIISSATFGPAIRGKDQRKNDRTPTDSGRIYTNEVWAESLREYEIGFVPMTLSAWREVRTIFQITGGGAKGFLLEDPTGFEVTNDNGVVEQVDTTVYQLKHRFAWEGTSHYYDETITRPRLDGFVPYELGVAIGAFSLDTTTGLLTIPSAPDPEDVTWAGPYYVPVHFDNDFIDWTLERPGPHVDRRLLSGPSCILKQVRE